MQAHISHNAVVQHNYGTDNYSYSPTIYNDASFQYSNQTVINGSTQDYQDFSIPPYTVDPNQYTNTRQNALPPGSSTADSNGSIVSELDSNQNSEKKKRKPAPTIATGRRNLKDETVNTEEADRRDKRRQRNRTSAQRCRERKMEKKEALELQILKINNTYNKYLGLAENVLKSWKQKLHFLNEKLPCNNYQAQLSVADFENVIEGIKGSHKGRPETGDGSVETVPQEHNSLTPQMSNTFITFNKMAPIYPFFNNEDNVVINSGYEQFNRYISESKISYNLTS